MKNVIFKFQFIVGLLLFACLNVQADDDLITRQITVKLDKAGTLPDKIGSARKYLITNLKIVGELNGTDFRLIRDMAGINVYGERTKGKLATLDLSEVKVVEGGDYYYSYMVYHPGAAEIIDVYTANDVVGDYSFCSCRLTNITIPSSVTSIGQSAFSGCSSLTNIIIPSGVTSIGQNAFLGCSSLTNISIPSGVTSIDQDTFSGCSSLTNIIIPSGVTSIGQNAFSGCSSLTTISIPSGVTSIGQNAFSGCCSLTTITIPSSVSSIGSSSFSDCKGLQSVYVSWECPLVISASIFGNVDTQTCCLYVPKGTYDDYWLTDWGIFNNIIEYDVTGIDKVTTSSDVKEISRYSVNGQRLDVPTKGLNIVKYSDGSVKKVVVQ